MAANILRTCAIGYLILVGIGCETYVPSPCHVSTKTLTWHRPNNWDGELRMRLFLSKDNQTWTKVKEAGPSTLYDNGYAVELDLCKPTYWCADQWDTAGLCSREAGCIGEQCQPVVFPGFKCGEGQ